MENVMDSLEQQERYNKTIGNLALLDKEKQVVEEAKKALQAVKKVEDKVKKRKDNRNEFKVRLAKLTAISLLIQEEVKELKELIKE